MGCITVCYAAVATTTATVFIQICFAFLERLTQLNMRADKHIQSISIIIKSLQLLCLFLPNNHQLCETSSWIMNLGCWRALPCCCQNCSNSFSILFIGSFFRTNSTTLNESESPAPTLGLQPTTLLNIQLNSFIIFSFMYDLKHFHQHWLHLVSSPCFH